MLLVIATYIPPCPEASRRYDGKALTCKILKGHFTQLQNWSLVTDAAPEESGFLLIPCSNPGNLLWVERQQELKSIFNFSLLQSNLVDWEVKLDFKRQKSSTMLSLLLFWATHNGRNDIRKIEENSPSGAVRFSRMCSGFSRTNSAALV